MYVSQHYNAYVTKTTERCYSSFVGTNTLGIWHHHEKKNRNTVTFYTERINRAVKSSIIQYNTFTRQKVSHVAAINSQLRLNLNVFFCFCSDLFRFALKHKLQTSTTYRLWLHWNQLSLFKRWLNWKFHLYYFTSVEIIKKKNSSPHNLRLAIPLKAERKRIKFSFVWFLQVFLIFVLLQAVKIWMSKNVCVFVYRVCA